MADRRISKISHLLCCQMWPDLWFHGYYILLSPFIFFLLCAADSLKPQAWAVLAAAATVILWLSTHAFARRAARRRSVPFCPVWLPLFRGPGARAEDERVPSGAVATLFFLRLAAGLLTTALLIVAKGYAGDDVVVVAPLVWLMLEEELIEAFIKIRLKRAPAAAASLGPAIARLADMQKPAWKNLGLWASMARRGLGSFLFWSCIVSPVWFLAVLLLPGMAPRPADSETAGFFAGSLGDFPADTGVFALAGLEAPVTEPDIAAFGRREAEALRVGKPKVPAADLLGDRKAFRYFNICNGYVENPGPYVKPAGSPPPIPPPAQSACLTLDEWGPVLDSRRVLLARYESLHRYADFRVPADLALAYPGGSLLLMDLTRLEAIAHAREAARGDRESALRHWLEDMRFTGRLVRSASTEVGFAVYLTSYSTMLKALPLVLGGDRDLARRYGAQIAAAILFPRIDSFDFAALYDSDLRSLHAGLGRQFAEYDDGGFDGLFMRVMISDTDSFRRALDRRLLMLSRDMHAALAGKDFRTRQQKLESFGQKYAVSGEHVVLFYDVSDVADLAQSGAATLMMSGVGKGATLFDSTGGRVDRNRVALAYVAAVAEGAWPDGMDRFLREAAVRDPVFAGVADGSPFVWDKATRQICGLSDSGEARFWSCLETAPPR